jgi:hypothetical protein
MHHRRPGFALLVAAVPILFLGCDRTDVMDQPIPAGVSVHPPRAAPATGSLALPGEEPDAAAQETTLTDTVGAVVEGPGQ